MNMKQEDNIMDGQITTDESSLAVIQEPAAELIRVTQLPIIEERLRSMKQAVEAATAQAMALTCTEETVISVKEKRTELTKQFEALEEQRKAVKNAVMGPYNRFEEVYKECITEPFRKADADLKCKIVDTETGIKNRCEEALRSYFAELCSASDVDFVSFEQTGVKIDMASAKSKTPKKLMEQLKLFITGIAQSAATIRTLDYADEIMVEFKRSLDATGAIASVTQRHKQIEEEQKRAAEIAERRAEEMKPASTAYSEAPPLEAPVRVQRAEVERLTVVFSVTDTRERLRLIKKFLDANGYQYK
jgi:hypothetical protein